ncbi:MAG: membrane protein insertase YidC [Zoogloeaceae bacterium]|jgi:YidC/Oxa1 family membrane protein insertase|nr:membrane protein insertase YidC [Zoogloeaceae bacterium]
MDNRRLLLLAVFCFSIFMLWSEWQRQSAPPPRTASAPGAVSSSIGSSMAGVPEVESSLRAVPAPGAPGSADMPTTSSPAAAGDEILEIQTDLYTARISMRGGDLVGMTLNRFRASDKDAPFPLLDPRYHYRAQSGLTGAGKPNHNTLLVPLPGPRILPEGEERLEVRLEAPEMNGIKATRVLRFTRGSYVIDMAWEIENTSAAPLTTDAYFQLTRNGTAPEGDSFMLSTFYGAAVYTEAGKYQKIPYTDVAEGKAKFVPEANDGWVALVQHYFVTAWLPEAGLPRKYRLRKIEDNLYAAALIVPVETIAPGEKKTVRVPLFAGPQEQARLDTLAPGLKLVVDYGMLYLLAAPIFWALSQIHALLGNWGWAIVALTIFIKLVLFPLSAASYRSMARMRRITPRLMQLKELYGHDKMRLNQEMMQLYKTEKINPLGGCLPILVQIPVFIALYWVLLGAVEMRGAPWILWIEDLSAADPYYVLPVIMMASMFLQTKLNPTPPDPIQAKVMMMMPLIFGIMFFFFPAGLVLYWVVNNVLSIAQQWQITRMIEGGDPQKAANDPKA